MVTTGKSNLVISLDFELMWGNIESWTTEGYGTSHVSHVREVITRLLALFEQYQVKATFATVGFIMQKKEDVKTPLRIPTYQNKVLSPYGDFISSIAPQKEHLYFATDIIEKLKSSQNVEIGTHTYCHYYCLEKGQTVEQFDADMEMAVAVAKESGIVLKSIVFPRNQVSDDYLSVCRRHGITSYRGNARKYFNTPKNTLEAYKNKVCRLLDAYLNIGGNTSYQLEKGDKPIRNIPASRFLRPYSRLLFFLEGLRFRRIRKEMEYAAKHGEVYHLWWHPHNFGANIDKNLIFLERILKTYQELHNQYGMMSMTMGEVSEKIQRH